MLDIKILQERSVKLSSELGSCQAFGFSDQKNEGHLLKSSGIKSISALFGV